MPSISACQLSSALVDEERRTPLQHASPIYFETHVKHPVVAGRHVVHSHGGSADEREVERLTRRLRKFADRNNAVRVAVDYVGSEGECDVEGSPAPAVPCPYLHWLPPREWIRRAGPGHRSVARFPSGRWWRRRVG